MRRAESWIEGVFWNNVDFMCKEREISLAELGRSCGIPVGTIKNMRATTQYRLPNLHDAALMAKVLNVSLDWLLSYEAPPCDGTDPSLDIKEWVDSLTPTRRNALRELFGIHSKPSS